MRRNGTHANRSEPGMELFGQVAVRRGFVGQRQVDEALARQKDLADHGHPHKLIGMIMLEMGVLGTTELIDILRDLQPPGVPAGEVRRPAP